MSAAILDAGEKYTLAMGMIGTLVGLVNMLSMDDPKSIGPAMAVAHYHLIWRYFGEYDFRSHVRKN